MNPIVSTMFIALFVIGALVLVTNFATDILEKSRITHNIMEIEEIMKSIDISIKQVYQEGNGSIRKIPIFVPEGEFVVDRNENSIKYSIEGPVIYEYLSRSEEGDLFRISGADVKCYTNGSYLIMENSFIRVYFSKVGSSSLWSPINTANNIEKIELLKSSATINITNSSVILDDDTSTSSGNGYSQILKDGEKVPYCITYFFINSTRQYEIKYILFAGADFIVQEVISDECKGCLVTENFAFSPLEGSQTKKGDVYLSSYNNTLFSVVFTGSYLREIDNEGYGASDQLFTIKQDLLDNRVLIVATNSSLSNFEEKIPTVKSEKILSTRFGNFDIDEPQKTKISLALIYDYINITKSLRWGSGSHTLTIKNLGGNNIEISIS